MKHSSATTTTSARNPVTRYVSSTWTAKVLLSVVQLIGCESQGVNISRPDSDGIFSDGILQFYRDGTGRTWSNAAARRVAQSSRTRPSEWRTG